MLSGAVAMSMEHGLALKLGPVVCDFRERGHQHLILDNQDHDPRLDLTDEDLIICVRFTEDP